MGFDGKHDPLLDRLRYFLKADAPNISAFAPRPIRDRVGREDPEFVRRPGPRLRSDTDTRQHESVLGDIRKAEYAVLRRKRRNIGRIRF